MGIEVFAFIPIEFVLTVEPPAVAANVGGLMLWLLLLIGLRKALATLPSCVGMFLTLLLLLLPPPPDIIWSVISVSKPSKEGGVALLLLSLLLVCIMVRGAMSLYQSLLHRSIMYLPL